MQSPSYLPYQAMAKGRAFPALFTMLDNKAHSDLKRTLSSAFSGTSIVSLEPFVDPVIRNWVQQTEKIYVGPQKVCSIGWWMQLFAFDVVSNLTYSKTHGMVEKHEDVDGIVDWLGEMFSYGAAIGQMPILDQFLKKNPVQRFLEWAEISVPTFATVIFAKKRIAERLETDPAYIPRKKGMREDLLTQMMESSKKFPNVLTDKMVLAQAVSTAFAGSDNTAVTLTAILYYLLRNPRTYKKLVEELDEAAIDGRLPADPDQIPTWEQSQKLTYFNAVVKEAQRLYPSVGGILERVTPPQGATIQGKWYPGNTLVGCNAWIIHFRKEIFGDDCYEFRPERWIEGDPDNIKKMNNYFFAFGAGTRACIGRNISLLEIGKAVPHWLRRFHVSKYFDSASLISRSDEQGANPRPRSDSRTRVRSGRSTTPSSSSNMASIATFP